MSDDPVATKLLDNVETPLNEFELIRYHFLEAKEHTGDLTEAEEEEFFELDVRLALA